MHFLIHACPERMWYVTDFLVPDLRAQGIDDIDIWNDGKRRGNLRACMDSFAALDGDGDTWHLQDDVLIARDFGDRVRALESQPGVICGFVNELAGPDANLTGIRPTADLWYSFPCIRIPDEWARECAAWTNAGADRSAMANALRAKNSGDDWFFIRWAALKRPDDDVLQLDPGLVEHVDYLLGGSIVNAWRGHLSPAAYWYDAERTEELKKRIKAYKALL